MAVEIRHSRTATLVDSGANPGYDANEIQASDWNDTHPITADGMGLLFADSAGDVAETMTVDTGTLTSSNPFTFKQEWTDETGTVRFDGVVVNIKGVGQVGASGASGSSAFSLVKRDAISDAPSTFLHATPDALRITQQLVIYDTDISTESPLAVYAANSVEFGVEGVSDYVTSYSADGVFARYWTDPLIDPADTAFYGPAGITRNFATNPFTLPASTQTALAQWANVPTNTDIADGYSQVGVDTNTGDIYLAANVGGTIFKVQLT